jgi:hypothetical protein
MMVALMIFLLPNKKSLTGLLPIVVILGTGLTLMCLSIILFIHPTCEHRRSGFEKEGNWLEKSYPEDIEFNCFANISDLKILR